MNNIIHVEGYLENSNSSDNTQIYLGNIINLNTLGLDFIKSPLLTLKKIWFHLNLIGFKLIKDNKGNLVYLPNGEKQSVLYTKLNSLNTSYKNRYHFLYDLEIQNKEYSDQYIEDIFTNWLNQVFEVNTSKLYGLINCEYKNKAIEILVIKNSISITIDRI